MTAALGDDDDDGGAAAAKFSVSDQWDRTVLRETVGEEVGTPSCRRRPPVDGCEPPRRSDERSR